MWEGEPRARGGDEAVVMGVRDELQRERQAGERGEGERKKERDFLCASLQPRLDVFEQIVLLKRTHHRQPSSAGERVAPIRGGVIAWLEDIARVLAHHCACRGAGSREKMGGVIRHHCSGEWWSGWEAGRREE